VENATQSRESCRFSNIERNLFFNFGQR